MGQPICLLDTCLDDSWCSSSTYSFSRVPIWEMVVFSRARWLAGCPPYLLHEQSLNLPMSLSKELMSPGLHISPL